jgi:hypothetical protein
VSSKHEVYISPHRTETQSSKAASKGMFYCINMSPARGGFTAVVAVVVVVVVAVVIVAVDAVVVIIIIIIIIIIITIMHH